MAFLFLPLLEKVDAPCLKKGCVLAQFFQEKYVLKFDLLG